VTRKRLDFKGTLSSAEIDGVGAGASSVLASPQSGGRRVRTLWVYAAALVVLAGASALWATAESLHSLARPDWWAVGGFVILAVVVERQSIPITPSLQLSVAFLPLTFVAVVFGPATGALVGGLSMLAMLPNPLRGATEPVDKPYLRWAVWTANRVLDGAMAGFAAHAVLTLPYAQGTEIVAATAAATTTCFAVDFAVTFATLRIRGTGSVRDLSREVIPVVAVGVPLYAAAAALLVYAYVEVTPASAALFFIPAIAAQRLFSVTRKQREALQELTEAYDRLESANLSFAIALVATLDARDEYTAGHSTAVAAYARDIAAELKFTGDQQRLVYLCGLVHDVGKIGLPPGLLEKPGALTAEERTQMEEHSAIGERILANVDDYGDIARIVRHHHERIDGRGYPDGLEFGAIPLISRIIAVADAYDAMTSDRPYREAMTSLVARERLAQSAGTQFDAAVVVAFDAVLSSAPETYGRRRVRASRPQPQDELSVLVA
jgi:putative nucleotidyltransferase with HDIG domain